MDVFAALQITMTLDCLIAYLLLLGILPLRGDVTLVREGKVQAVIVIPERATRVVVYAAKELVEHVQRASGAKMDVVSESLAQADSRPRVYLGPCRESDVDVGRLAPEAFVLRVTEKSMVISGDDSGGDPLDSDTRAGTLWGVYEWLDRDLGVRWLWPGELGMQVPHSRTVAAKSCEGTQSPRFFQRRIRSGLGFESSHPALGFTGAALNKFSAEQTVFLRRHRMGRSYPVSYGHAFTDWWEKDGQTHPDWFQSRAGGKRGPTKKNGRFSMCVSDPDLQREIVSRWAAKRSADAKTPAFINACENDILGLCECERCRALDGQAPADYLRFYSADSKMIGSRFVSDRYAHFWLGVQKIAEKTHPDVSVIGYAYFNYFQAPVSGIKLNSNILIGFCPSAGWFPRSEAEHQWMKQQWTGWRETGARLFMRTNHLLDGYCMPFIFAHQFADEFHHAVSQGMVATDYDSLTGHWATQGPNLYIATRLHTRPEASADELLSEYYDVFGPAASQVRGYFDYWEIFTSDSREKMSQIMLAQQTSRWRNWVKAAHLVYPPDCFMSAEKWLLEALQAASGDDRAMDRVKFLQLGLVHAKLCSRVSSQLTVANPKASKDDIKCIIDELIVFRRSHEKSGIGNFNHLAWVEELSWKLSEESRKASDLYP